VIAPSARRTRVTRPGEAEWFTRVVGVSGTVALIATTLIGQIAQAQVADDLRQAHDAFFLYRVVGGGRSFVLFSVATEQLLAVALIAIALARRNVHPRPARILASNLLAAVGLAVIAIHPTPLTLLVGLLPTAAYTQATAGIRTVVSTRYGDTAGRAESRVQRWYYMSLSAAELACAGLASTPLGWRPAILGIALAVAVQGVFLSRWDLLPDPDTEEQPGRDQPLRDLTQLPPVMLGLAGFAIASASFTLLGNLVQAELIDVGWALGSASIITALITTVGRVVTLPVARGTRLEYSLPRSLQRARRLIVVAAVLVVPTLFVSNPIVATALIVAGALALEGGQNLQNKTLRSYMAKKSGEAIAMIPIVGALATYLVTQVDALAHATWAFVPIGLAVGALANRVTDIWLRLTRYESAEWHPTMPDAEELIVVVTPKGEDLRLEMIADGGSPETRIVSDGSKVRLQRPYIPDQTRQSWIAQYVLSFRMPAAAADPSSLGPALQAFTASGHWPRRPSSEADQVVLLGDPTECLQVTVLADGRRQWRVRRGKAIHTRPILAGKLSRGLMGGPPLVGPDGVYGTFHWKGRGPGRWWIGELVMDATYVCDEGEVPFRRDAKGRWVLPGAAAEPGVTVPVLVVRAKLERGKLQHLSYHH
jgi:hypothetical protein